MPGSQHPLVAIETGDWTAAVAIDGGDKGCSLGRRLKAVLFRMSGNQRRTVKAQLARLAREDGRVETRSPSATGDFEQRTLCPGDRGTAVGPRFQETFRDSCRSGRDW
jgi:hypothetical protein